MIELVSYKRQNSLLSLDNMRNVFSEIQFLISSVSCTLHTHFHRGMTFSSNLFSSVLAKEQLPWHCLGSCSNGWISGQGGQMEVVSMFLQVKVFCCLEGCLL